MPEKDHRMELLSEMLGLPCLVRHKPCKVVDEIENAHLPETATAIKWERCYPCFLGDGIDTRFPEYFETDLSPRCKTVYNKAVMWGLW